MSRGWREAALALLAGVGVVLLGFSPTDVDWLGVAYAFLAGVGWAGYILVSPALGRAWKGLDGLAVASVLGAVVLAVPAVIADGPALADPTILGVGLAVGLPRRTFSILMSLEPAVAAGAAFLILSERLSLIDLLAMACVITASIGVTRASAPKPD
jgi:inner membrane transporter RhtA